MHFVDIGKRPPVFDDAARVALELLQSPYEFDVGQLYYNVFRFPSFLFQYQSHRTFAQSHFTL